MSGHRQSIAKGGTGAELFEVPLTGTKAAAAHLLRRVAHKGGAVFLWTFPGLSDIVK